MPEPLRSPDVVKMAEVVPQLHRRRFITALGAAAAWTVPPPPRNPPLTM